jgi:predicted transcriptional regulator
MSDKFELVSHSADIVAAYVSHNAVPASDLPALIAATHDAPSKLDDGRVPEVVAPALPVPAVAIKKSITAEAIICLEDGKAFQSLKRHLKSKFDLTPKQYREKWNLPADYPMVAPAYAERRSQLAKKMGLGTFRKKIAQSRAA